MGRPLAIDLFSGCGGLSLGLEAAGFDVAGAVEVDPVHALVHHFNFSYGVTLCQDINTLDSDVLLQQIRDKGFMGEIDLIAGGPPCQGFSLMGKRQLEDPRNQLVFEYLRIVDEIRPKYFIFENVAGMATGKHRTFRDTLINRFKQIGYQTIESGQVLDSSLYGVPQKRKRLFILGYRDGVPPICYPIATTPTEDSQVKVSHAIEDLEAITVHKGKDTGIPATQLNYINFRKNFSVKNDGAFKLCHKRSTNGKVWGHLGSNHTQKSTDRFAQTQPGKTEKVSRFYRLHPDGLSNTLRAGTPSGRGAHTAARPIHYAVPRCISIREAARLHTFPDWFQFHRTIWHGFREIGNAVVPLLAKQIGDEIIKALNCDLRDLTPRSLEKVEEQFLSYTVSEACAYWEISRDLIPKRTREKKLVSQNTR
ncbi:DNA cytosine methyltransferase [[Limnothrix rosea] IAM M-220]|uniref:DNA cytosine methyltransferase n=1 Tax=[Limnothrix rosea] IAM M-220 TaxID=454133 RepID=UPI00095E2E59|nr:DNA cytosine methyltransferase [[Limnothrix rosea] IAM M-220]OKH19990.1 DNA (cytosine-5-)-methyltransferase [[Limnothrix rosea] IAM M-220]